MIKPGSYFVTGTDTGIGKTTFCQQWLKQGQSQGLSTLGLKPIASGAELIDGQWSNEDARILQQASSLRLNYNSVNPFLLKQPLSPHLAAKYDHVSLNASLVVEHIKPYLSMADLTLIEGAGGWLAPINDHQTMADLAIALDLPVILVVGIRLGCLNHALLSANAIVQSGLSLAGWVANCIDPTMLEPNENITTLNNMLPATRLHTQKFESATTIKTEFTHLT